MADLKTIDIQELLNVERDPCISIYLPTHRTGSEIKQDPIRFKNFLRKCEKQLIARGFAGQRASELLRPGFDLLQNALVWSHQKKGLAAFISADLFRWHSLALEFQEQLWIDRHFHIKPLVPLLMRDSRFYILSLSQGRTRLYEADDLQIREKPIPGAPRSLAELLQYDETEEHIQLHTTPKGKSAGSAAIFHGHGNIADDARHKKDIDRYVKAISKAVEKRLAAESCPMVLAGVEYLQAAYRESTSYPSLVEEGVAGSGDELHENELHKAALRIVQSHSQQQTRDRLAKYGDLSGTDYVSTDIRKILPAANHGRVNTLFVDHQKSLWGKPNGERVKQVRSEPKPGDRELIDLVTRLTLIHNGAVYSVTQEKLPEQQPVAAIFRY